VKARSNLFQHISRHINRGAWGSSLL